jgi:hypothetical protein
MSILLEKEQYYLDLLNPEFNILKTAGNSLGFKHTQESIKKMRKAQSGENHPLYGKKHTDQTKQMMSIAKGGSLIFLYSLDLEELLTFSSARAAAEHFICCPKTILRYVRSSGINIFYHLKNYQSNETKIPELFF